MLPLLIQKYVQWSTYYPYITTLFHNLQNKFDSIQPNLIIPCSKRIQPNPESQPRKPYRYKKPKNFSNSIEV